MIVISGTIPVKPDQHDAMVAALNSAQAATRKEAGCISYQFSVATDDPAKLCLFEEWDDDEALQRHLAAPHVAQFGTAMAAFATGRPSFFRYEVTARGPFL